MDLVQGRVYKWGTARGGTYAGIYIMDVGVCGDVVSRSSFLKTDESNELGFARFQNEPSGKLNKSMFIPLTNMGVSSLFYESRIKSISDIFTHLGKVTEILGAKISGGQRGPGSNPIRSNLKTLDLVNHGVDLVTMTSIVPAEASDWRVKYSLRPDILPDQLEKIYFNFLGQYVLLLNRWLERNKVASIADRQKTFRQMCIVYSIVPKDADLSLTETRSDYILKLLKKQPIYEAR